jgi:hypothetical protein
VTTLVPFLQTITDAQDGIENAAAEDAAIKQQLSHGCGLLEGYYRAGGTSKLEYEQGCVYLRRVANQRLGILQLQREAAAAGLADV